MDLAAILQWIGGVVLALGGLYIAIHQVRTRERRTTHKEIQELVTEVDDLRNLLLEQRRYIYRLVTLMIDAGMNPPRPPDPGFDPGEYDEPPDPSGPSGGSGTGDGSGDTTSRPPDTPRSSVSDETPPGGI